MTATTPITAPSSTSRTTAYKMRNNPAYTIYNASIAILKTPAHFTPDDQRAMQVLKEFGY